MPVNPRQIHIGDFDYQLPDERIAKFPLPERDSSKLLVYNQGKLSEDTFRYIGRYIPEDALMVFNNTRVIRARLRFYKETGAQIEIFLLEPAFPVEYQENFASRNECRWYCLVGNLKKWKDGNLVLPVPTDEGITELIATRCGVHGTSQEICFRWKGNITWSQLLETAGELPIPPYLNRRTQESDLHTYQTVYSKVKGSVAAPTAGLHFTERVLQELDRKGIERQEVTLHVGAGTFRPVKSSEIGGHPMHTEHIAVHRSTLLSLLSHQGKTVAVGTTSVRTLESLYYMGMLAKRLTPKEETGDGEELHVPQWMPYDNTESSFSTTEALETLLAYMDRHALDVLHSSTQIIIVPGYHFHLVNRMITNFHQPQSTLLLLVSAFVHGQWHSIYDYALRHDFRFLSYGDSSILIP